MRKYYSLKISFFFSILFLSIQSLNAQVPTVQASNVQVSYKYSGAGTTVSWTRGNGDGVLVVLRKLSSSSSTPSSGPANYSASGNYGGGSSLGNGDNYVVYKGTGTSVYIYGLAYNTIYACNVYEYNTLLVLGTTYYYYNTSSNLMYFNTLAQQPTCGGITSVSAIASSSATAYFTAGNGKRFITVSPASTSASGPSNGYYYTASTTYGSGSYLGGAYVIYDGTGTSTAILGLTGATTYKVYDYEYAGGTYPTSSSYNYNSRSYVSCGTYTFNTYNYPPTLSSISSQTVCQDVSYQAIALSGIDDGSSNENQSLSISATTNNSTLINYLSVSYASPNATGTLYYRPAAGQYGTATVSVTVNDGWTVNNTTIRTFTITVLPKPSSAGSIAGTATICAGVSTPIYSISPTANTTGYTWTLPSGFAITSGSNTNVVSVTTTSNTTSGIIKVTPINNNGCGNGGLSQLNIQVDQQPAAPYAGPDQNVVCNSTAYLNATPLSSGDVGTWSYMGSPAPAVSSSTVSSTSVTGLYGATPNQYKFIWTVSKTGSSCPVKRDTMLLTADFNNVACTPSADFFYGPSSDVSVSKVCINTPVNFTDLSVSADTWLWDFKYNGTSVGTNSTTVQNPSFTYTSTGTYTVYLKTHSNATSLDYTQTKIINVIGPPLTPGAISGNTTGVCAGNPNQFIYSITSVNNATGYTWTTPSGVSIDAHPSNTSIAVIYQSNAVNGNISVYASNSCGSSSASTLAVIALPLPSAVSTASISGLSSVCEGQNVTFTVTGFSNATSFAWTDLNDVQTVTQNTFATQIAIGAASGTISVIGSNACGNGDTVSLNVNVNPLPGQILGVTGLTNADWCPVVTNANYSVNPVSNATGYNWVLPNGISLTAGNNTDNVTVDFSNSVANGSNYIKVYATNACGNGIADSVNVTFNALPTPQICMVTVDSASLNNIIIWDKYTYSHIDSFVVYREVSTNNYMRIGAQPFAEISQFIDTVRSVGPANGDPNVTTYRYKIQLKDSCGNSSSMSPYHNSIYFLNTAGSFSWNTYDVEGQPSTPVTQFDLMRDDNSDGTWHSVGTAAGTQNILTDPQYSSFMTTASWRVEASGFNCVPLAKGTAQTVNKSKSNVKNNLSGVPTSIGTVDLSRVISITPNPAKDFIIISSEAELVKIEIYNVIGEKVYENQQPQLSNMTINIAALHTGVYTLAIEAKGAKMIKKIIKE